MAYMALALGADWLTHQASEFSTFWPAAEASPARGRLAR
jgi:hypothetical protein